MKIIRKLFRKKPTLQEKVVEMYGEEAGKFYDMLSSGIPIGGFMKTIDFLNKVETARKVWEGEK